MDMWDLMLNLKHKISQSTLRDMQYCGQTVPDKITVKLQ